MIYISQTGFDHLADAAIDDWLRHQAGVEPQHATTAQTMQAVHEVVPELLGRYEIADDELFEDTPPV